MSTRRTSVSQFYPGRPFTGFTGPVGTKAWNKWRTARNRAIENPARLVIDLKAPTRSQLAAIRSRIELDPDITVEEIES